jgi:hypothetical protein
MRTLWVLTMFFLLLVVPHALLAAENEEDRPSGSGWAVDAKIGSLGVGVDVSRSVIPRVLNVRTGVSFISFSTRFTDEDINYNAKLRLSAVPIAADVFPFKNWLRLGGGVIINLSELKSTGVTSTGTWIVGDHNYTIEQIGLISGNITGNRVAPYFGVGFNNPIRPKGRVGFFADLGFMYHGTPKASMTSEKSIPGLQADIDKEIVDMNNNMKGYKVFPIIQLGFSYRF